MRAGGRHGGECALELTAKREILEELGINIDAIPKSAVDYHGEIHVRTFLACRPPSASEYSRIRLHGPQGQELCWLRQKYCGDKVRGKLSTGSWAKHSD